MLTANQLRQVAGRSGARDIGNVEIDVILTNLLQLFAEKGIMDHVGFKGGTMLRKMVFGPRGRLSTDLDFTSHSDIGAEDLMLMMLDALERPYHGISFRLAMPTSIAAVLLVCRLSTNWRWPEDTFRRFRGASQVLDLQ